MKRRSVPEKFAPFIIWGISFSVYLLLELVFRRGQEHGKSAKVLSDIALSATTAFPFWWLTEWITKRRTKQHIAELQSTLYETTAKAFNMIMDGALTSEPPTNSYDFYRLSDDRQCVELFNKDLNDGIRILSSSDEANEDPISKQRRIDRAQETVYHSMNYKLAINATVIEQQALLLEPYRSSFSLEFNRGLQTALLVCKALQAQSPMGVEMDVHMRFGEYLKLRNHLRTLEAMSE